MNTPYDFALLKYVHDAFTGEFVVIGVALCATEVHYYDCRIVSRYARLSSTFTGFNGALYRTMTDRIGHQVDRVAKQFNEEFFFEGSADVMSLSRQVLPSDSHMYQFEFKGTGTTEAPAQTLDQLFDRYVNRYIVDHQAPRRDNKRVWREVYKGEFDRVGVTAHLKPHKIKGKHNFSRNFNHTWKNGIWNLVEPISFDLVDATGIREKAVRWQGRLKNLGGEEDFRLIALLGEPRGAGLSTAFDDARKIIGDAECETQLVDESEASFYAIQLKREMDASMAEN